MHKSQILSTPARIFPQFYLLVLLLHTDRLVSHSVGGAFREPDATIIELTYTGSGKFYADAKTENRIPELSSKLDTFQALAIQVFLCVVPVDPCQRLHTTAADKRIIPHFDAAKQAYFQKFLTYSDALCQR